MTWMINQAYIGAEGALAGSLFFQFKDDAVDSLALVSELLRLCPSDLRFYRPWFELNNEVMVDIYL
jgi:hypothetical protein